MMHIFDVGGFMYLKGRGVLRDAFLAKLRVFLWDWKLGCWSVSAGSDVSV